MLKAALNGDRSPGSHPGLPVTIPELQVDAFACVRAGASALHIHPRNDRVRDSLTAEVIDETGRAVRTPAGALAIDLALDRLGITAPRLHHGEGDATWPVLRQAVRLGRDIRIGLEDTLDLPDGTGAPSNEALVTAAVRLARMDGGKAGPPN
jgi:uncharacterized protein (DUF849 family)